MAGKLHQSAASYVVYMVLGEELKNYYFNYKRFL